MQKKRHFSARSGMAFPVSLQAGVGPQGQPISVALPSGMIPPRHSGIFFHINYIIFRMAVEDRVVVPLFTICVSLSLGFVHDTPLFAVEPITVIAVVEILSNCERRLHDGIMFTKNIF